MPINADRVGMIHNWAMRRFIRGIPKEVRIRPLYIPTTADIGILYRASEKLAGGDPLFTYEEEQVENIWKRG